MPPSKSASLLKLLFSCRTLDPHFLVACCLLELLTLGLEVMILRSILYCKLLIADPLRSLPQVQS